MKKIVTKYLGEPGIIFGSKGQYRYDHPDNYVSFNSNVVIDGKKVWHGDFDLTLSISALMGLAKELNKTVYLLYETDARFENEDKPIIENYLFKTDGESFDLPDSEYYVLKDNKLIYDPKMIDGERLYTKRIKLLPLYKYMSKNKKETPIIKFYRWLLKEIKTKKELKELNIHKICITEHTYNTLKFLEEIWAAEVAGEQPRYAKKHSSIWMLNYGPRIFYGDKLPSWVKDDYIYLMEDIFFDKE